MSFIPIIYIQDHDHVHDDADDGGDDDAVPL